MSGDVFVAVLAGCFAAFAVIVLAKQKEIRGNITIVLGPPSCPAEEAAIMRARILLSDPR